MKNLGMIYIHISQGAQNGISRLMWMLICQIYSGIQESH